MNYRITINGMPDANAGRRFRFDYGAVKNITVHLQKNKMSIECEMKTKKSADQLFTSKNNCFSEALKKGMLFHLLLYSTPLPTPLPTALPAALPTSLPTPLPTGNIRIFLDDKESSNWNAEGRPIVYSLINDALIRPLPSIWQENDAVYDYFCSHPKSKQGNIAASLYALLYSKTKKDETERFLYLWMSMNGLYNHLAEMKFPEKGVKGVNGGEATKMQLLADAEGWGKVSSFKAKDIDIKKKILEEILWSNQKYGFESNQFLEEVQSRIVALSAEHHELCDVTIDGLLNLWYPYSIRCSLFHANTPLSLFALENEFDIARLRFVNGRLEAYLEKSLLLYFDESYCRSRLDMATTS